MEGVKQRLLAIRPPSPVEWLLLFPLAIWFIPPASLLVVGLFLGENTIVLWALTALAPPEPLVWIPIGVVSIFQVIRFWFGPLTGRRLVAYTGEALGASMVVLTRAWNDFHCTAPIIPRDDPAPMLYIEPSTVEFLYVYPYDGCTLTVSTLWIAGAVGLLVGAPVALALLAQWTDHP